MLLFLELEWIVLRRNGFWLWLDGNPNATINQIRNNQSIMKCIVNTDNDMQLKPNINDLSSSCYNREYDGLMGTCANSKPSNTKHNNQSVRQIK